MGDCRLTTERKRKFIINVFYYAIIIALFYLAALYLFGWIWPFVIGFFVALILQKPLDFLYRHIKVRRSILALLLVIFTYCVIGTLLVLIGIEIVNEVKDFISYLISKARELPNLMDSIRLKIIDLLKFLPDEMESTVVNAVNEFFTGAKEINISSINFSSPLNGILGAAKQVPSAIVSVIITFISTAFITIDYRQIVNFIRRQLSPKNRQLLSDSKQIFMTTIWRMIRAYALLMTVTFVEMTIGLYIIKWCGLLQIDYIVTLAAVIAIVDILPVLGVGTVLIPWGVISLISGRASLGIALLILYVAITLLRNYLEPRIVGGQIGLNPVVTLLAMYLGLQTLGFLGMFVLPMIVIILKILQDEGKIKIWKTAEDEKNESAGKKENEAV